MPTTNAAIPMQILKPLPTQPAASAAVPETTLKRSKSLPSRSSVAPDFVPRAQSLTALHKTAGSGGDVPQPGATGLSEDTVNAFLKKAGLDIALRENRLFITRHRDPEAAEAQRPPSGKDLARVCHALMVAEETPAKLDAARTLLPAINAQLLEHIEADQSETSMKDKVMALAKSYCTVLGGRDLAIDDVIGIINTYFFDRIGDDKALNSSNIAAAALTSLLMLTPTVGKNLPLIADAIREGRYRDAIMPAFSICAVSAMTLNPDDGCIRA